MHGHWRNIEIKMKVQAERAGRKERWKHGRELGNGS